MRLRIIEEVLKENIPYLTFRANSHNSAPPSFQITDLIELRGAIREVGKLPILKDRVEKIKDLPFYIREENTLILNNSEYQTLKKDLFELQEISKNLASALSEIITEENPEFVSIKLPNPVSFKDLEKITGKLDAIFSQTLLYRNIDGVNIQIKNFDTGSFWIDILVGTVTIVNIVAGLAWSAAVVYKKLQEGRLVQAKVKQMNISNQALEEIITKSKDAINSEADKEANFLYNTFFKGSDKERDNEQVGRIRNALKELAEFYSEGGEIYPALSASEKIKENFPNMQQIDRIETKVQMIEAKSKTTPKNN